MTILIVMLFSAQTCYSWAEELNDIVYYKWQKKVGEHFKDMVSKAMARPDDEIIDWLPTPFINQLKPFRQAKDFKKWSRKNSINKRNGLKGGAMHTLGFILAEEAVRRMAISICINTVLLNYCIRYCNKVIHFFWV